MTSPWPVPDTETKTAMCCLCFSGVPFDELSVTPEGELTDVCMDCRFIEIQMVLKKQGEGLL